MDTVPLWALLLALAFLILCSAFFAMAETALMAANRYRLRHQAKHGSRAAANTLWLLERTDKLLSLVLIVNTLVNAAATALVTAIAIGLFGREESVITIATAIVAFLLIVFAEISPKVIGATYPEKISLASSWVLKALMSPARPIIWFVNLFVNLILRLFRVRDVGSGEEHRLSPEELRSIVLESGNFIPQKHKSILLNLFDFEAISVEDIMTPRAQIEALDLAVPIEDIKHQLVTCYHNKLLVYEGEINRVIGILHVRKAMALLSEEELSADHFRALVTPPYFIPQETPVLAQLQYFQEKKERLAVIVDEYGELQGLVTLDDIIEEMIGEFTTTLPGTGRNDRFAWDEEAGACLLEGATPLRDINKHLNLHLPLDGPKTLNGLILEQLQEIPEFPVTLKIANCIIEVVQVQNQSVKVAKLYRP